MRESVKKQLEQCAFANLNNYNEEIKAYIIPKYTRPKYDVGKSYLVKLPKSIINNPNNVVNANMNSCNAPKQEYYKIYVSKTLGTYIYVDGLAYDYFNKVDLTEMWSGYLDTAVIDQIEKY